MAAKESKKISIEDVKWFKKVLKWQKATAISLGKERGGTSWTERTIRQSLQDGKISRGLLDAIAKEINVQPDYLIGKYSWTRKLPIMEEPGVRDYWDEHFLCPSKYPYIFANQAKLGTYRHLLNTLLIHGVSEEEYMKLDAKERHRVEFYLDRVTTDILQHWFPEADFSDRVDYYLAMEWNEKRPEDVIEALLPYLIERGLAEEDFSDWDDDDEDPFADKYKDIPLAK